MRSTWLAVGLDRVEAEALKAGLDISKMLARRSLSGVQSASRVIRRRTTAAAFLWRLRRHRTRHTTHVASVSTAMTTMMVTADDELPPSPAVLEPLDFFVDEVVVAFGTAGEGEIEGEGVLFALTDGPVPPWPNPVLSTPPAGVPMLAPAAPVLVPTPPPTLVSVSPPGSAVVKEAGAGGVVESARHVGSRRPTVGWWNPGAHGAQTTSRVPSLATATFWSLPQLESALHWRALVPVGAWSSYSSAPQSPEVPHTRSDTAVGAVASNRPSPSHAAQGV